MRLHTAEETYRYTTEYKQAIANEALAKKKMNEAIEKFEKVEKPPFPKRIEHDWEEPR